MRIQNNFANFRNRRVTLLCAQDNFEYTAHAVVALWKFVEFASEISVTSIT